MADWNKTGDCGTLMRALFQLGMRRYLSFLTPPSTCWLHLNTTDGGVALWGCSGHQNKTSRSQKIFKPTGGVVQFSVCRQRWAGEMLDPHLFASSYCFLWRLSLVFFQGSALKPESPVCGRRREAQKQCCAQFQVTRQSAPRTVIVV